MGGFVALDGKLSPNEANWAPVGYEGTRVRLTELVTVAIPPESEQRIAETQA